MRREEKESGKGKIRLPWNTKRVKGRRKSVLEDHHIIPGSRNGNRANNILAEIPSDLHWSYHRLFGNLLPLEVVVVLLKHIFVPGKFKPWQKSVTKKEPFAEPVEPDEIILSILELFPDDWVPGDKLLKRINAERTTGKS